MKENDFTQEIGELRSDMKEIKESMTESCQALHRIASAICGTVEELKSDSIEHKERLERLEKLEKAEGLERLKKDVAQNRLVIYCIMLCIACMMFVC